MVLRNESCDLVISSDLQRACDTARPLVLAAGVAWITDATLRERCFGAFEGLRYDEIETHFPQAHELLALCTACHYYGKLQKLRYVHHHALVKFQRRFRLA